MKKSHKVLIFVVSLVFLAVSVVAQEFSEDMIGDIAGAITDFRVKLVSRFDHLEYTILKSTKEMPVIYARDDLVRDRIVLNNAQGIAEELVPLPNGMCNVTVVTGPRVGTNGPATIQIMEARDALTTRNSRECLLSFSCSHTVNINDEYFMIKSRVTGGDVVTHMSISYQCWGL